MCWLFGALAALLPNSAWYKMNAESVDKHALACSNMAASRNHVWSFDGKKTHWVALATSCPNMNVSLVSIHDKVKFTITSRTA